jgi:hypothetical protein
MVMEGTHTGGAAVHLQPSLPEIFRHGGFVRLGG